MKLAPTIIIPFWWTRSKCLLRHVSKVGRVVSRNQLCQLSTAIQCLFNLNPPLYTTCSCSCIATVSSPSRRYHAKQVEKDRSCTPNRARARRRSRVESPSAQCATGTSEAIISTSIIARLGSTGICVHVHPYAIDRPRQSPQSLGGYALASPEPTEDSIIILQSDLVQTGSAETIAAAHWSVIARRR